MCLPATHFSSIFLCAIFHNVSQLTKRLDEASPSFKEPKNDCVRPRDDGENRVNSFELFRLFNITSITLKITSSLVSYFRERS